MQPNTHISLQQQIISGTLLREGLFERNIRRGVHAHEHANLCLVLKGTCSERLGSKVVYFKPLTLGFLEPGDEHSLITDAAQVRYFALELAPVLFGRLNEYSTGIKDSVYMHGGTAVGLMMRIYREFHLADSASPLAIEGLLLEVTAETARYRSRQAEKGMPHWLEQASELLRAEFTHPPPLSVVAAAAGVHPVHLAREFRRHFKCTIGEYIRRRRVEYACRRLLTPDIKLAWLALEAGFADQSHFTREFKRVIGITPSEYRKSFGLR